jgi:predicted AAA+ superfamily ATPase
MYARKISNELLEWKDSSYRKPLVLRGARQVGKTTVINDFSAHFEQYIYLNLERSEDKDAFKEKGSIREIVDSIFFLKNKSQQINDTLIFITRNTLNCISWRRVLYWKLFLIIVFLFRWEE